MRLIGVIALAYVIAIVDLARVLEQLHKIALPSLAVAAASFAALVVCRCWRWHLLIQAVGVSSPAKTSFAECNASIWLGLATPARAGEFKRALTLARRSGKGVAEASALVLFDLAFDLLAYSFVAFAGLVLLLFVPGEPSSHLAYGAILVGGFVSLSFICLPINVLGRLLRRIDMASKAAPFLEDLGSKLKTPIAFRVALATTGAFLSYALMMAALIGPMQVGLRATELLSVVGMAGVAGALPISYFGLGTRDLTLIWYLNHLGIARETAVAVSFAFIVAQLVGLAVSLTLAGLLRRSDPTALDVRKEQSGSNGTREQR